MMVQRKLSGDAAGEYEFKTTDREIMEILSGDLDVLLPGGGWKTIKGGQAFEVPANANSRLR